MPADEGDLLDEIEVAEHEMGHGWTSMKTWIALLRGINVGGHRKLPMKELTAMLESVGGEHVRTYIQSGNVAYRAPKDLGRPLADEIESRKGFRPEVTTLTLKALEAAATQNPFPDAEAEPKTLHLFFLSAAPRSDAEQRMREVKSTPESFVLADRVLYLHTPALLTGSKIAAAAERLLGISATARNWRSVERILTMARSVDQL